MEDIWYARESWDGDSRDGKMQQGEGFHYLKLSADGMILQAFEWYESDSGEPHVSKVPELCKVHWIRDLGYEDFDVLQKVSKLDFEGVEELISTPAKK